MASGAAVVPIPRGPAGDSGGLRGHNTRRGWRGVSGQRTIGRSSQGMGELTESRNCDRREGVWAEDGGGVWGPNPVEGLVEGASEDSRSTQGDEGQGERNDGGGARRRTRIATRSRVRWSWAFFGWSRPR